MSNVPNSSALIQQEAVQTTKPVSESLAFALGGGVNQAITNSAKVGDLVPSLLALAAFQGQRDTTWVLCDGEDVTGSQFQALTGLTNVPDFRGRFLRGKDNGAGVDTHGDLALGTLEADQMIAHTHQEHYRIPNAASGGSDGGGDHDRSLIDIFENVSTTGVGTETHPKYGVVNWFVKINP